MHICISCGLEHEHKVGDSIFELYLTAAHEVILRNIKRAIDLSGVVSPVCERCVIDFRKYLELKMPEIAAGFYASILGDRKRSNKIKEGIELRKKKGLPIGRPPIIPDHKRREMRILRKEGYSFNKISRMTGYGKSTIFKVLKKNKIYSNDHQGKLIAALLELQK